MAVALFVCHCRQLVVVLQLKRKKITVKPQPPEFEVSPPIQVTIDQAVHTVVYGPYYSPKRKDDLFPYAHDAGSKFYNQNYEFYLASNSRIMNPLHGPKLSDNGGTHTDYMNKQRTSQKGAGTIMRQLLGTLCGEQLDTQTPESFEELDELLQQYGVCLYSSVLPSISEATLHSFLCIISGVMVYACNMHGAVYEQLC